MQRIYHTVDSFVVVAAKAYHGVINLGYNIASAANIANSKWFSTGSAFLKRTSEVMPLKTIPIPFETMIWEESTTFVENALDFRRRKAGISSSLMAEGKELLPPLEHYVQISERKIEACQRRSTSTVSMMASTPYDQTEIHCHRCINPVFLFFEMCSICKDIDHANWVNHFAYSGQHICNIRSHNAVVYRRFPRTVISDRVQTIKRYIQEFDASQHVHMNKQISDEVRTLRTASRNRRRRNARAAKRERLYNQPSTQ